MLNLLHLVELNFLSVSFSLSFQRFITKALTWSQMDDALALHALPATHSSNVVDCSTNHYYQPSADCSNPYEWHNHYEDLTADDADFAMDFGDFIF